MMGIHHYTSQLKLIKPKQCINWRTSRNIRSERCVRSVHPGMDREVPLMFSDRFASMQKQKLYDNERRHFRKDWLYECALQCNDDHVPPETQNS